MLPNNLRGVVQRPGREVCGGVEAVGGAGRQAAGAAGALPARRLRARAHRQPLRAARPAPRPAPQHNTQHTPTGLALFLFYVI